MQCRKKTAASDCHRSGGKGDTKRDNLISHKSGKKATGFGELTPTQRRRLEETGAELDKVCASDRLFFERRPERQYRVRRASRVEIEHREIIAGGSPPPFGMAVFVAVRNVVPGLRLRAHFIAAADADTDLTEDIAKTIFDDVSSHDPEVVERLRRAYENA